LYRSVKEIVHLEDLIEDGREDTRTGLEQGTGMLIGFFWLGKLL
jgi:hypothetical protein